MKKLLLAFVFFFLLASFVRAEEDNVIVLDDNNFDEELKKYEYVLVEFYAPWCGHCKALEPEYKKAAELLKGVGHLAKIDADANRKSGEKHGIQGFPTLKLFRNGKEFKDFDGGRKAEQIVSWYKKKTGPPAKTLKSEEVEAFIKENNGKGIVGHFAAENDDKHKAFLNAILSEKVYEDFPAAVVFGGNYKVTLYRSFEAPLDFTGELEGLKDFVVGNGYPLVEEIGAQNFQRFVDAGLPLAVAFFDYSKKDVQDATTKVLTEVATKLKGKFSFSFSDGVEYKEQLESMGGDATKLPALAAMNIEKRVNYPYSGELTVEAISAWAHGIIDGTVKPFYKSDPIPETQDGPVYVLVGKTFEQVVHDESKDVLVEFYAPWCGHCKNLEPKYNNLATFFKGVDSLLIAKMDSTTNDCSIQVEGFPTLYFFPKGSKQTPIQYDGPRTEKGLVEFLKKHAIASKDQISGMTFEGEKKEEKKTEKKDEL